MLCNFMQLQKQGVLNPSYFPNMAPAEWVVTHSVTSQSPTVVSGETTCPSTGSLTIHNWAHIFIFLETQGVENVLNIPYTFVLDN